MNDMWIRFFVATIFVACRFLVRTQEVCTTPENHVGVCILLQKCPSIFASSSDFETPLTLERLDFLIESQCGFDGINPKVCCSVEELQSL
ncbi:unnamed protein product [Phyllotreta striolata]|uniref:Clip domain-containing protein n=1 Tax=Phyllotreta striolata TaxID=444603 RepID=A0A9N9TJ81_PHYSR|nr:unnamed protein product [Phyllotreta striolata]